MWAAIFQEASWNLLRSLCWGNGPAHLANGLHVKAQKPRYKYCTYQGLGCKRTPSHLNIKDPWGHYETSLSHLSTTPFLTYLVPSDLTSSLYSQPGGVIDPTIWRLPRVWTENKILKREDLRTKHPSEGGRKNTSKSPSASHLRREETFVIGEASAFFSHEASSSDISLLQPWGFLRHCWHLTASPF